jgi:hypothetical protein
VDYIPDLEFIAQIQHGHADMIIKMGDFSNPNFHGLDSFLDKAIG